MSVNVIFEVQAKPEKIDELKSVFEAILPDTRNYDGCIGVKVIGKQDDPLNLLLFET